MPRVPKFGDPALNEEFNFPGFGFLLCKTGLLLVSSLQSYCGGSPRWHLLAAPVPQVLPAPLTISMLLESLLVSPASAEPAPSGFPVVQPRASLLSLTSAWSPHGPSPQQASASVHHLSHTPKFLRLGALLRSASQAACLPQFFPPSAPLPRLPLRHRATPVPPTPSTKVA